VDSECFLTCENLTCERNFILLTDQNVHGLNIRPVLVCRGINLPVLGLVLFFTRLLQKWLVFC